MSAPLTRRSALSTIAGVAVAASLPAMAVAVHPDVELIVLGRRFDELVVKWNEFFALPSTDIDDEACQAVIDRLVDEMRPIERRIIALRATTLDGLRVKVRVVRHCVSDDDEIDPFKEGPSIDTQTAWSIMRDLLEQHEANGLMAFSTGGAA